MDAYEKAAKGQMQDEQKRQFIQKIMGAREKEKKTWLMLASVHMRRMEFAQAVNAYTRVVKLDSTVPAAYVERAQAYGALAQYKLAIKDLNEYLKITDPQMHRSQRLSAVELLDRYQTARARQLQPAREPGRHAGASSQYPPTAPPAAPAYPPPAPAFPTAPNR